MEAVIELRVNCASQAEAEGIARAALERRLAAAANVLPPVVSRFRWRGEVRAAEEVPLVLRSREGLFGALTALISELHSYEVPGVAAVRVDMVSPAYRDWVLEVTSPAPG